MHCTHLSKFVVPIAIYLVEKEEKASYMATANHTQQYKHSISAVKYAKPEADTKVALMFMGYYRIDLEQLANTPRVITVSSFLERENFLLLNLFH